MKKLLFLLLVSGLAAQTNVQKGSGSVLSNGPIVVGSGNSITATGSGIIHATVSDGAPPTGAAGGDLTGTYPNPSLAASGVAPGVVGSATTSAVVNFDAKGRAIVASSTAITPPWSAVTGKPSVNTSAPLTGGGSLATDLTLAMPAATTSINGYLTSTDWNTFNNKQPSGNYITALTGDGTASGPGSAALTLATVNSAPGTYAGLTVNGKGLVTGSVTQTITTTTPLTGGGALGNLTLAMPVATGSANGYLSSADWSTFNGKQAAGNYVTGLTGDVAATGPGSVTATLATVNSTPGTYAGLTVNGKGLVTAAAAQTITTTSPLTGGGTLGNLTLAMPAATTSVNGYLTSTDWNTFNGKQASGNYLTALTGDGTASGPGSAALTLATVNSNVGAFGNSTAIPTITVNAKGLVTAASTNAVIAPAGTLTGTTLASNVVSTSITSVGTSLSISGAGTFSGASAGAATTLSNQLRLGSGTPTSNATSISIVNAITGVPNFDNVRDESVITATGDTAKYDSYDASATFAGATNYDHLAAYQDRQIYSGSGSLSDQWGFYSQPTFSGTGITARRRAFRVLDIAGSGIVTNNYGLYVDALSKAVNNYAIWTDAPTQSQFNGPVYVVNSSNSSGASAAIAVKNDLGTSGTLAQFSSTFSVAGLTNRTGILASGALSIVTDSTSSSGGTDPIDFLVGGYGLATPTMRLTGTSNLLIGTTTDLPSGNYGLKLAGNTASSSTTTGSLVTAGGAGFGKAIFVGTSGAPVRASLSKGDTRVVASNTSTASNSTASTILASVGSGTTAYAALSRFGPSHSIAPFANRGALRSSTGLLLISDASTATGGASTIDFQTGGYNVAFTALRLAGATAATGTATLGYTLDSTTTGTGALVVGGGVGIAKAVFIGTTLNVAGASTLTGDVAAGGDVSTTTAGKTVKIKSGSNAKAGTFTLVAGTVTVANTAVTANSVILPTVKTSGGTRAGLPDIVPTAGVGFTATSTSALDTSTYNYVILEVN